MSKFDFLTLQDRKDSIPEEAEAHQLKTDVVAALPEVREETAGVGAAATSSKRAISSDDEAT